MKLRQRKHQRAVRRISLPILAHRAFRRHAGRIAGLLRQSNQILRAPGLFTGTRQVVRIGLPAAYWRVLKP